MAGRYAPNYSPSRYGRVARFRALPQNPRFCAHSVHSDTEGAQPRLLRPTPHVHIKVSMERIVLHLDMDAFFAAVEERDNPRFAGRPIVVGADPKGGAGRGVVSTANYAARKYGIRSAMPITTAWRLAEAARTRGEPAAVFLGGGFRKYAEVSDCIMAIVRARPAVVAFEQVSVDEAYIEFSIFNDQFSKKDSWNKAKEFAQDLKREIYRKERLTCSIGIGPNKIVAKIASDREKPDGLTVVRPEEILNFLAPLPVRVIPGIGPKTEAALARRRIHTVEALRALPLEVLIGEFGRYGGDLYRKARGEDDAPVAEDDEVKSIGEQETLEEDTKDMNILTERLKALAAEVHRRFAKSGFRSFRTVVLTVRFADFETKSRAHTLPEPAATRIIIEFEALKLLLPFLDRRENPRGKKIRLLGVRVEKLT